MRASTNQYRPACLIYRRRREEGFDWHGCSLAQVQAQILRLMPEAIRPLYSRILRGEVPQGEERQVAAAMDWIGDAGSAHGFRIPNVRERMRSTGREEYLETLRIGQLEMFNLVGNHFDPDALRVRLQEPLNRALAAPEGTRHQYCSPGSLAVIYRSIATQIRSEGMQVQPAPFPMDLRCPLAAMHGGMQGGEEGEGVRIGTGRPRPYPHEAAESGCAAR